MNQLLKVLFTSVALFLVLPTTANATEKGQSLQDYVNQLSTFKADFVQVQPDEATFSENRSTGRFELSRPGQLVWEYIQPEEQKIVVDGLNLWFYDLDLDQVTVRPIDDVKNELPLSWLLYKDPIEEKFTIIESKMADGEQWFNLVPKAVTFFQSIDVAMKDGEMTEVWMYQSTDNITKVRFNNIQSNSVIPYQTFQFQLPAGVDLVGSPQ